MLKTEIFYRFAAINDGNYAAAIEDVLDMSVLVINEVFNSNHFYVSMLSSRLGAFFSIGKC